MVKKTPIDNHQQILKLKEEGKSTREIAKIVGCSNTTVSRIKPLNDQGKHKAKIGRPRELDMHDVHYICRLVSTGKCGTATQVQQELQDYTGILVSVNTILRVLHQNRYHSHLKKNTHNWRNLTGLPDANLRSTIVIGVLQTGARLYSQTRQRYVSRALIVMIIAFIRMGKGPKTTM